MKHLSPKLCKASSGFTLLEVMIAMMIMAVLSILTSQTLKSAVDNRAFVTKEVGRDSRLADAVRLIRNDVSRAFHYQDIDCKMKKELAPKQNQPNPNGIGIGNSNEEKSACPPDHTGFIGDSESLYFSALTNVRTLRDSPESDQAKIGYFVKSCVVPGKNKGDESTRCLYRSISPYLDEELDTPGPETLLLEYVKEFKLRYLGPEREEYVDSWKTGKNGDAISKDKFPYAVEVTLTVHNENDPKDHAETTTVLAPVYFTNNPKKPAASPAPGL